MPAMLRRKRRRSSTITVKQEHHGTIERGRRDETTGPHTTGGTNSVFLDNRALHPSEKGWRDKKGRIRVLFFIWWERILRRNKNREYFRIETDMTGEVDETQSGRGRGVGAK